MQPKVYAWKKSWQSLIKIVKFLFCWIFSIWWPIFLFFYTLDQMSKNQKYLLEFFRKISRKIPILYPDHEFKILFNWFIVILLFIDISYAGFLLIIEREDKSNYHLNNFEKLIVLTPKIFFFIEIFLNFFTAYYDKGILVKRKRSIIQHFIKTEFPLDVFSIILPFFF